MADTLHSLPGNAANNKPVVLKGTPNNDVLHGSLGHTTFYGGLGNDIYYSKNAGDTIVEYAHEGNDTVLRQYNLYLTNPRRKSDTDR